jgi:hypothetical protein
MATQFVEEPRMGGTEEKEKKTAELAGAGATTEAIGAAAAIVLAIIGLAGLLTDPVMAVATIVLGAAVLMDAAGVSARYKRIVGALSAGEDSRVARAEIGGGISAGTIGGITGVVLGILALLGIAPTSLCSVALIVLGGALLFGSAEKKRLASLHTSRFALSDRTRHAIDEAIEAAAGGDLMVGIGAVVLGILALLGLAPATLVLVGYLGVGAALLLSGSAFGARMFGIVRHASGG